MNPPATLEDLNPQWLTACLSENGHLPQGAVTAINAREPLQAWSGTLTPLEITYVNAVSTAPTHLIYKQWHSTWTMVAQHELYFYRMIAPHVSALRVPRLYYAYQAENEACALYEDFSADFVVTDFNDSPPVDRTKQVIDVLAEFHAYWWDHAQLQAQQYQHVQGGPLCMAHMATQDGLREYDRLLRQQAPQCIDAFGDALPGHWRKAFEWAVANWHDLVSRRSNQNLTLIHGDVHWRNIAWHKTAGDLLIFDWETHKRGLGAFDLAYLLHDSYWQDDRQRHELPMMRRYHQALLNAGVADYSWEAFEDDYRLALITLLLVHMQWRGIGLDHVEAFIDDAITGFELWGCRRLVD